MASRILSACRARFRFSLRTLFVVFTFFGIWSAVNLRGYVILHRFQYENRMCSGFQIQSFWDSHHFGDKRLVFLSIDLPFPPPRGGSQTGGTLHSLPSSDGLSQTPRGLFLDGEMIPDSDQGGVWVYLRRKHEVVPINLGADSSEITPDVFANLETTDVWKNKILPFVKYQNEQELLYRKEYGYWAEPNLPFPPETIPSR